MKKLFAIVLGLSMFSFYACDPEEGGSLLSEDEIVQGLKKALEVGTDSAVGTLNLTDGYYKGAIGTSILKIFLPPEADIVVDNISAINQYSSAIGYDLEDKLEEMYLSVNRSAEDAANTAGPIFGDAITSMTIGDGMTILKGSDTAATEYLRGSTFSQLTTAFAPKIDASLDKPLITLKDGSGTISANDLWDEFKKGYAKAVSASEIAAAVPFSGVTALEPMNDVSLGEFVTGKALNGLFLVVGAEEGKIRKDPFAYVSDILEKVFGSLLKK